MASTAPRYASALIDSARAAGLLEAVEADLAALLGLLAASAEFTAFLTHPLLPYEKRAATLDALFAGKLQGVTINFLKLLAEKERLPEAPQVLEEAWRRLREARGVREVEVVSAVALTEEQEAELAAKLVTRLGGTVELKPTVDASLIGGFRLKIGDLVEDYSLSTKLETFKRRIINA